MIYGLAVGKLLPVLANILDVTKQSIWHDGNEHRQWDLNVNIFISDETQKKQVMSRITDDSFLKKLNHRCYESKIISGNKEEWIMKFESVTKPTSLEITVTGSLPIQGQFC